MRLAKISVAAFCMAGCLGSMQSARQEAISNDSTVWQQSVSRVHVSQQQPVKWDWLHGSILRCGLVSASAVCAA